MTNPEVFYNAKTFGQLPPKPAWPGGEQTTQPCSLTLCHETARRRRPRVRRDSALHSRQPQQPDRLDCRRSDGEHYGTSVVYDFPKTRLVDGRSRSRRASIRTPSSPASSRFGISKARTSGAAACWSFRAGARCSTAEPIYLQADRSPMPELRLVLALQDKLAYAPPSRQHWLPCLALSRQP